MVKIKMINNNSCIYSGEFLCFAQQRRLVGGMMEMVLLDVTLLEHVMCPLSGTVSRVHSMSCVHSAENICPLCDVVCIWRTHSGPRSNHGLICVQSTDPT